MKNKINEDFIFTLKKDNTNKIVIENVDILNPLKPFIDKLIGLCDKTESSVEEILNYIQKTKEFEQLNGYYRYCLSLSDSYQGFIVNIQKSIEIINKKHQKNLIGNNENTRQKGLVEKGLISKIKGDYIKWNNAFAIKKAYLMCQKDKSILAFSHREAGWSNPICQLTSNFSIELKTNFGYGWVSYFYTKLKYKNIEITPFSEWINYEKAKFSEIIRYTKSYQLDNEYWLDAMLFSCEACNLSLTNEEKFLEKYVMQECEKMVRGLENILGASQFYFKKQDKSTYKVDKNGHVLVEFRGEKISGALDFISRIIEFDAIVSMKKFIKRIENCNRKLQPTLVIHSIRLENKIKGLNKKKNELQTIFDEFTLVNNMYSEKRDNLLFEIIGDQDLKLIHLKKLESEFIIRYPDYNEFKIEYKGLKERFNFIIAEIKNYTMIRDKIVSYDEKINKYFGK